MEEYRPRPKYAKMLNEALKIINSVKYKPSTRWAFYQMVQRGYINKKDVKNFDYCLSKARKSFYNGWTPDTLSDSIRVAWIRGLHSEPKPEVEDRIIEQDNYVEIWFEARAMFDQFVHYTRDYYVSLVPFAGDPSIAYKWEIAKRLEDRSKTYKKPIIILYFGDCDTKGFMIPESAINDIKPWSNIEFKFIRCGLTLDQAKKYKIPENPDRKGQYQWEALNDKQAGFIIMNNLLKYWKKPSF